MEFIASSATFLPNCDLGLARHLEPSHPNGGVVFHDSSPCPFALNQSQQAQVAADNSQVLFVVGCLLVAEEVAKASKYWKISESLKSDPQNILNKESNKTTLFTSSREDLVVGSNEKKGPWLAMGYTGDGRLPSYMGIIINHKKDPY